MNRNCFTPKMTQSEQKCLYTLVKLIYNIFKKNNIHWIPTGGSLLAIHRHNKLTIPWDDDYDITIRNKDKDKAIKLLKTELPKYNANITFRKIWKGGDLYKIYWTFNNNIFKNTIRSFNIPTKKYTWPFIDLFINVKNDFRSLGAFPLSKYDYPLKEVNIEGMLIKIPTNGIRKFSTFFNRGFITTFKEQLWSHKYEKKLDCIGKKETNISNISNNLNNVLKEDELNELIDLIETNENKLKNNKK